MPDSPDQHTGAEDEPAALSARILALLAKMTERFDSAENEEWRWLIAHSPSPLIVEILQDSTPMTLRMIDAIGRMEPVNGVTISERYRIPKGTVSKITRRLIAQGLISHERLPNNRKELLFRLTPPGRDLLISIAHLTSGWSVASSSSCSAMTPLRCACSPTSCGMRQKRRSYNWAFSQNAPKRSRTGHRNRDAGFDRG